MPRKAGESWASTPAVRRVMEANRPYDTGLERVLRSLLFRMGLRYRKHYKALAKERVLVDIAFPRERVAVFVDGCFWHGCPEHGTWPKSHADYWREKILANRDRDRRIGAALEEAGWVVLRIWEHDDPLMAAQRVAEAVRLRRSQQ